VEAVCSGDGLEERDILDMVASLLDKSVLTRDDGTSVRYRMLETIRQYGEAKLETAGELDQWRTRHRDWYADLVDRSYREWVGPDQVQWVERLGSEHPNLRAALEYAIDDPDSAPIALRMCSALEQYWMCAGLISEARHWCDLALAHETGTVSERTLALRLCVWFGTLQTDLEYAERMLERAYEAGGSSEDPVIQGYLLFASGVFATWQHEVERGVALLLDGVEAFRRAGNVNAESHLLFMSGMFLGFAQEFEQAADQQRQCLAVVEPRGELYMRSYALWGLGVAALHALDLQRATSLEQESLRDKWALKDMLGISLVLETLSWIAAAEGRGERAATLLGAAGAIAKVIGLSVTRIPYISDQRELGEAQAKAGLGSKAFQRAFAHGKTLPLDQVVSLALEEVADASRAETKPESPLTKREEEVAQLIGEGLSNREIAARLVVSQRTAQGHVENILRKLGFTSRTQVAAWVAERKVAEGPPRHLRAVGDG
jgi:DNA-binding CsgD family transcriptional regulator